MSLINDALKRASQSDRNRPRPTETHAAMEPVTHQRGWSLVLVLGTAIIVALALAAWCFGLWWRASHPSAPANVETAAAVAPKPVPPPVVHEAAPPPQVIAPKPVAVPVPVPAPAPPPPVKPVVEAWPVDLKLMGIFFSKTNPRALINGKTVSVDDEIDGIRITKIEHDQVTVEWNGQVKVLIIE